MSNNQEERRKHPRKKVNSALRVEDADRDEILGMLADISEGGLMMLTPADVRINRVYQLMIRLNELDIGAGDLRFGAESLWSELSGQPGATWVGFQIIDISDEQKKNLQILLECL